MADIPRPYRQWCADIHRLGGSAEMDQLNGLLVFGPETSLDLPSFDLLRMVSLGLISGADGYLGLTGAGQAVAREHQERLTTA